MQRINRQEQANIILAIEKDFALLIKSMNYSVIPSKIKAHTLVAEIRQLNDNNYFDDDLAEYLENFALSIENYVHSNLSQNDTIRRGALLTAIAA